MNDSVFSPNWYRVADLKPRLRTHVRSQRQIYRRQTWYVLRDLTSNRHHRINAAAFEVVGRLDGKRSLNELWNAVTVRLGDSAPSQDEIIRVLARLNEGDLLQSALPADATQVFQRRDERRRKQRLLAVNPLAFRVSLFDPSNLLAKLQPLGQILFHPLAFVVWAGLITFGVLLAASNWQALAAFAGLHALSPKYLLLFWLCYPVIKFMHEIGHALAVKVWGGEVHEMGVSLLLFVPVPYVDASAASSFREKSRRIAVSAAGIMVELFFAVLALIVWLAVEDGMVRDIAFAVALIGGVSTVIFNGNPLLKFDAYYALADAVELPNLGSRSARYFMYLAQRFLLGVKAAVSPAASAGERIWFLLYGSASYCYRWVVAGLIVLWLGGESFLLGLAVLSLVTAQLVIKPIVASLRYLAASPELQTRRVRAIVTAAACATGIAFIAFYVPLPFATLAEGVVMLPERAHVRAAHEGFIVAMKVADGEAVKAGDLLLVLDDPELTTQEKKLVAEAASLEVQYHAALIENSARATRIGQELSRAQDALADVRTRIAQLEVRSSLAGRYVMPWQKDLEQSFVAKGAVLAHVLAPDQITVRVAVPHADAALVRSGTQKVAVRLAEDSGVELPASISAETPAATNVLPSAALGDFGGGRFTTDPADAERTRVLEQVFLFDVSPTSAHVERIGARAWVRFEHEPQPAAIRISHALQQLFLRHFELRGESAS